MFFAVERYKHMHEEVLERIAVFDTKDCSVEVVNYLEAEKHGVFIDNVYTSYSGTLVGGVEDTFMDYLFNYGDSDGFVRAINRNTLMIGDYKLEVELRNHFGNTFFAYPFLYNDCIILRYYIYDDINSVYYWLTFAVNKKTGEKKMWNEYYTDMDEKDKAFAIKVDTLFEV